MSLARLARVTPPAWAALSLTLTGGAVAPLTAQARDSITLERAIALAQEQGLKAQGARASWEAARYRDQAFGASNA